MKYFWEGAKQPFAENLDGIARFLVGSAESCRAKHESGARIVDENGVSRSWDDVIGLVYDTEPEPVASPREYRQRDQEPRKGSGRGGKKGRR